MTDLNPEIWENPTLGAAAQNENLDRVTKQALEDRSAKVEGREAREVVIDNTYPGWAPEVSERTGTVPSNYQTVHFADEAQNDVPVDSGPVDETAGGIEEGDSGPEESSPEVDEDYAISNSVGTPDGESGSAEPVATQEGDSTQWT